MTDERKIDYTNFHFYADELTVENVTEAIAQAKAAGDKKAVNELKAKLGLIDAFGEHTLAANTVTAYHMLAKGDIIEVIRQLMREVAETGNKKAMAYIARTALEMRDYAKLNRGTDDENRRRWAERRAEALAAAEAAAEETE